MEKHENDNDNNFDNDEDANERTKCNYVERKKEREIELFPEG